MSMNLTLHYPNVQVNRKLTLKQWLDDLDHHGSADANRDETNGRCLLQNPCPTRDGQIIDLLDQMSIHWSAYKCEVVIRVLSVCFNTKTDAKLYKELAKRIRNGQARRNIHDLFQLPLWLHLMDVWDKKMIEG